MSHGVTVGMWSNADGLDCRLTGAPIAWLD